MGFASDFGHPARRASPQAQRSWGCGSPTGRGRGPSPRPASGTPEPDSGHRLPPGDAGGRHCGGGGRRPGGPRPRGGGGRRHH
ncbi:MAG: hypothetical protein ACLRWQ_20155 [Flavonifractor plautii]